VDRFVRQLPEGYDTVIEENASSLSSGERQLLTIARAFIANPSLLILDEATSSVDTRTEVLVQQAMRRLRADRTSFGCGNSANATWFGQAFLIEALNQTTQFRRAFLKAQGLVAEREAEENEEPSEPQWQAGEAISDYLRAWSEQLPERPAVAFVPAVEVVSESGENSAAKNATDVEVHTTKGSDSH